MFMSFSQLEDMAILPCNTACVDKSKRLSEYLAPGVFQLRLNDAIDLIRNKNFDARRTMYFGLRLLGRWIEVVENEESRSFQVSGVSLLTGQAFKRFESFKTEDSRDVVDMMLNMNFESGIHSAVVFLHGSS